MGYCCHVDRTIFLRKIAYIILGSPKSFLFEVLVTLLPTSSLCYTIILAPLKHWYVHVKWKSLQAS